MRFSHHNYPALFLALLCSAAGQWAIAQTKLVGFGSSATGEMIEFTFAGSPVGSINAGSEVYSVARDRVSGKVYIITRSAPGSQDPADQVAEIDVDTGTISNRATLSVPRIDGITVVPRNVSANITILNQRIKSLKRAVRKAKRRGKRSRAKRLKKRIKDTQLQVAALYRIPGIIYGVAGSGGTAPQGTIFTIDAESGLCTDTGFASAKNTDGQSLEYNRDDGLLYHFMRGPGNTDLHLESIHPDTGIATSIGALNPVLNGGDAVGAAYLGNGQFLISVGTDRELRSVSTAGAHKLLGGSFEDSGGTDIRAIEIVP